MQDLPKAASDAPKRTSSLKRAVGADWESPEKIIREKMAKMNIDEQ